MLTVFSALMLSATTLTNVAQVAEALRERRIGAPFDVTGTITFDREESGNDKSFSLADKSETQTFCDWVSGSPTNVPPPGTVVRLVGALVTASDRFPATVALVRKISTLGSVPPPPPRPSPSPTSRKSAS